MSITVIGVSEVEAGLLTQICYTKVTLLLARALPHQLEQLPVDFLLSPSL